MGIPPQHRSSPRKARRRHGVLATAAALLATLAMVPALAAAAAVGAEPYIPPSPHIPDGEVLAYDLGCGGGDKALGPPSRTAASGNGTTYAYWAGYCDFNSTSPSLRLHLNATVSDYGGEGTEPPGPHESTVVRVVLVAWSHFEAEGGVEVVGPTRAHAEVTHPLSPTADWSDTWGAAPLNVTIANNTFAAGAVIRFVGALPPRSSLLIAGNAFADARLLGNSGAFAAGNIFLGYALSITATLVPCHALILVTPHASDGGQWALTEGTTASVSDNSATTAYVGWGTPHGVANDYGDIGFVLAAVSAGTASSEGNMALSSEATLSLSDNALRIIEANETLPSNIQRANMHVVAAGLFLEGLPFYSMALALSASGTAKVRISRNNASIANSAVTHATSSFPFQFRILGAFIHGHTKSSQISSIAIDGNSAAVHNSTVGSSMYVYGCYWYSSGSVTTTTSDNASITINDNGASVHNSTAGSSMVVYGYYWLSSDTATTSNKSSISVNGNSAAVHNSTAEYRIAVFGCHWDLTDSATATTSDNASISVDGNSVDVHYSKAGTSMAVYGCYWEFSAPATASNNSFITVNGNSANIRYSTAVDTMDVYGCYWHSFYYIAAIDSASITGDGNNVTISNSIAGSMSVRGCSWYSPFSITASDSASITGNGNNAAVHNSAARSMYVYGYYFLTTASGNACITVNGNGAAVYNSSAGASMLVYGCYSSASAYTTVFASGNACITASGSSADVHNSTAGTSMQVYGCYTSASHTTTCASDNASIAFGRCRAAAFDVSTGTDNALHVAGSRLNFFLGFELTGFSRLRLDSNTAVLSQQFAAVNSAVVEVHGAVLKVVNSQGGVLGLTVAAGAQVAARNNSVNLTALPQFN